MTVVRPDALGERFEDLRVVGASGEGRQPLAGRDGGLWIVLALLAAYSAVHIGFRLAASWSLGEDDPIANIVVQELRTVYDPRQPPLYDWVLYAVQKITGPTIVGFLAIKYAALIATGAALYATARRAIGPGVLALLTVESLALIYQVSWRFHEGYTHQVGAMLAVAATMWATMRTIAVPGLRSAALLGAVAALGMLTEAIYAVFLVALVAAVAIEPAARRRLAMPQVALAALLVAPAAAFVIGNRLDAAIPAAAQLPGLGAALGGLVNAARAPLFYLSPLILILPVIFPGFVNRAARDLAAVSGVSRLWADATEGHAGGDEPAVCERIVLRTSVIGFVLSLAGAAALGLKGYSSHVYMPLYITSVVWLMGVVRRTRPSPRSLSWFGRLALVIALFALVARLANMFVLDPVCKICRWGIPYAGLATELASAGADDALIVTIDHELGGNLRAVLPHAAVALARGGSTMPERLGEGKERVVLVWSSSITTDEAERQFGSRLLGGWRLDDARVVRVPWRHLWRPEGYRFSEWRYAVIGRR